MSLKEQKKRTRFNKSELSQLMYKEVFCNSSFNIKRCVSLKFFEKDKNIYSSRIVNRCLLTNRSRGVSRRFKMARYPFRIYASKGLIPGVKKTSW